MPSGAGARPAGSTIAKPAPAGPPAPSGPSEASWEDVIRAIAKQEGVDPDLALSVSGVESSYNPSAIGPMTDSGEQAHGLFQLMPGTAKELGVDRDDPIQNIQGGLRYLKQQLKANNGDLQTALYAYNAGPGNVAKGIIPEESKAYATAVQSRYLRALQAAGPAQQGGVAPPAAPVRPDPYAGHPMLQGLRAVESGLTSVAQAHDPRTPEGRVNLAGTGGAIAATALTGGSAALPWIARVGAPVLGSMLGAGGMQARENAAGTSDASPLAAAAISGGAELAGPVVAWPFRAAGRFVASTGIPGILPGVAKTAKAAVEAGVDVARLAGRDALDTARASGARRLADLDIAHAAEIDALTAPLDRLPVASTLEVGRQAADVLHGPAAQARKLVGQRVADAAETGPAISTAPVRDRLSEMTQRAMPSSVWGTVRKATANPIGLTASTTSRPTLVPAAAQASIVKDLSGKGFTDEQIRAALTLPPDHPLPGILGRVQRLPDELPFAHAHALKKELDDAIRWGTDVGTKKRLEHLTMGVRGTLRQQMAVHEPYNVATDAAHRVYKVWETTTGLRLQKAARVNPDAIAATLKPTSPAGALAMQDLLLTQAAKGGDAAAGQQAWNGVRAAFTDREFTSQGIDTLSSRIATMERDHPDFMKILYGDPDGQAVLGNLRQIGDAYSQAVARQAVEKKAAQALKAASTTQAKRTAGDELRGAIKTKTEFGKSTLARFANAQPATVRVEELRHPITLALRFLRGPSGADLATWASRSPQRTQWMVRTILSPAWDRSNAAVIRGALAEMHGTNLDPNAPAEAP